MDDILIFGGQTKEQHHAIVVWVLDIIRKHQLYLKAKKCTFGQPMVEYLSLMLLEGCIEMDPVKVACVCDWLTPRNVTEVQSFKIFCMWPNPFTNSPRKERCGNGLKTNRRPSKNSNGSSPQPPSSYNPTKTHSSDWIWTLLDMPQEQFYPRYVRMTSGTQ